MEVVLQSLINVDGIGWGKGGLNELRLVSKRLMHVIETCATRLTHHERLGPDSLPLGMLKKLTRIQHIKCYSHRLRSLEGCPDRLHSIEIYCASLLTLEPLKGCIHLEQLSLWYAHEISDISPISGCKKLKKLRINNSPITDLSPLASLHLLEDVNLFGCESIKSLVPISGLMNLWRLNCWQYVDIPQMSLLPLATCTGLKQVECHPYTLDLQELKKKMSSVRFC